MLIFQAPSSWCEHSKNFVDNSIKRLNLSKKSFIIEIASNDGYLLQYFKEKIFLCLGIEPTRDTARESKRKESRL